MARIEPIPIREWPPEMRDALAAMTPPEPRHPELTTEERPKALNLLSTFAHHPPLARAFFTFNGHLLRATTLTERQRELLVLRVAARRDCDYEWGQHVPMATGVGLSDTEIARVPVGPDAGGWDDLDAALLRAADELLDRGAVTSATWQTLSAELDAPQLLDVIYTVGAYQTLAWMILSAGVDLDDDLTELARRHRG